MSELEHLRELFHQVRRFRLTAPVDDDFRDVSAQLCLAYDRAETLLNTQQKHDLIAHLYRQIRFSEKTFGPGPRLSGLLDHINKELHEIEQAPDDLDEWVDLVLLAMDGAWRSGHTPEQIADAIDAKMTKNENRDWPDWREVGQDQAIEHIRS